MPGTSSLDQSVSPKSTLRRGSTKTWVPATLPAHNPWCLEVRQLTGTDVGPCSEQVPTCPCRRMSRLATSTSISKLQHAHAKDEIHGPLPRYMHDPKHLRSSLWHIHVATRSESTGGRVEDAADCSETDDCVTGSDRIKAARQQIALHVGCSWLATHRARRCRTRTAPLPSAMQMQRSMYARTLDRRADGASLTHWTRHGDPSNLGANMARTMAWDKTTPWPGQRSLPKRSDLGSHHDAVG